MFDTSSILHLLMWPAIILGSIVVIVTVVSALLAKSSAGKEKAEEKEKPKYKYTALPHFLTPHERAFYNLLGQAVGGEYRIFAQVHLDALLDEKVPGQNYKAARAHMSQKSVDFVLCDKDELRIVLAIELDDSTHSRPDRVERDGVVDAMLQGANIPLLRFSNVKNSTSNEISEQIKQFLSARKG